ncbi:MAG: prolyl oligopeptidase family serine peptidase [Pseudomonadota bacterium]
MSKTTKPYGTWASPITADLVAGKSLRFGQLQARGENLYWSEGRPSDAGRITIVGRAADGTERDLLPPPYSARSGVHEYGGGEMLVADAGVYFTNAEDQDVYLASDEGEITRITNAPGMRFADFCLDEARGRLIAVAERHEGDHDPAPQNLLAAIDLSAGAVTQLVGGNDFYAFPRIAPDGSKLAWVEWSLPHMPWEGSALKCATWSEDGGVGEAAQIAGGDGTAAFQPEWAPDGSLFFVWERNGWGNIHRFSDGELTCVCERDAEFGLPLWGLNTRTFAIRQDGKLFAFFIEEGRVRAGRLDPASGDLELVETGLSHFQGPSVLADRVAVQATSASEASFVGTIGDAGEVDIIRHSAETGLPAAAFSAGQTLKLDGPEGRSVWANYYPPANTAFEGPEDELPPMVVSAHGGPTGMADRGLKLKIQYWTSRGFAFLDVDYAGSWGYGRAYREALNGEWGIADVEDVIDASLAVADRGLADRNRMMISGGSAGGFTVLCALAFHDVYAAGASSYGVADLQKLLELTHKFESGYLYALTGTAEGGTDEVFNARSPVHHAEKISAPVIFFQGDKDFIVPPGQSREMVASLEERGVPVAYFEFEGEGHGFRAADTIKTVLEAEYAFYARVLKLEPDETLPDLPIRNMGALT